MMRALIFGCAVACTFANDLAAPVPLPSDACLESVFTTATNAISTVSDVESGIRQCTKRTGLFCSHAVSKTVKAIGAIDEDVANALSVCNVASKTCANDLTAAGKAIEAASGFIPTIAGNCTHHGDKKVCVASLLEMSGQVAWAVSEFVVATGDCGKQTALTVCLKSVLQSIVDVHATGKAVAAAIDGCKAHDDCAGHIGKAVDAMAVALKDAVVTGNDCGLPLNACVKDVSNAVDALKKAETDVQALATACKAKDIEGCVADLVHVVKDVIAIGVDIGKAFRDCRL